MDTPWLGIARSTDLSEAETLWCAERLVGSVHRLAWLGQDGDGNRRRFAKRFTELLQRLQIGEVRFQRTAVLGDWWLQVALGESPLGVAWQVDDRLPGWLGEPLRRVLDMGGAEPALRTLQRPRRFARARKSLRALLENPAKLKKTPAPEIYGEARQDAWEVLNAAEDPEDSAPPKHLRLLEADCEEWASEPRASDQLLHGVKVWNTLVRHLQTLQAASREVLETWTTADPPAPVLDAGTADDLAEIFGAGAELARAFLHDVMSVADERPLPPLLDPRWVLEQLGTSPSALDIHDRVSLLGLVREATEAEPTAAPPAWAQQAAAKLDHLRDQVRGLKARAQARGQEDAVEMLEVGLERLQELDSRQADEWIREAEVSLDSLEADREMRALTDEMARMWADLEGSELRGPGYEEIAASFKAPPPATTAEARERQRKVHAFWKSAQQQLHERLKRLRSEERGLGPGNARDGVAVALAQAETALEGGFLTEAARAMKEAEAFREAALREEEERFGPALRNLTERSRDATLQRSEWESLRRALDRVRTRASANLPYAPLVEALEELLAQVARDERARELAVVCIARTDRVTGELRLAPVAWEASGVEVEPRRLSPGTGDIELASDEGVGPDEVVIIGGPGTLSDFSKREGHATRLKSPPRAGAAGAWLRVIDVHSLRDLDEGEVYAATASGRDPRPFFIRASGVVQGPYGWHKGAMVPVDSRGFTAEMEEAHFAELYGLIALPSSGQGRAGALVHMPPSLSEMLDEGATAVDTDDATSLELWLARHLEALDSVDVEALASLLAAVEKEELPGEIRERRVRALGRLLETSGQLARERRRAAERFLQTDEGRREVQRAARRLAEDARDAVDFEIEQYRSEREAELAEVEARTVAARERLAAAQADELRREAAFREELTGLESRIAAARGLLDDAKARLMLEMLGRGPGGAVAPSSTGGPDSSERAAPIRATPYRGRQIRGLRELVDELEEHLGRWPTHDVANLLACLLSSRWTVLAGPPGAGKSTLARELVRGLGHGAPSDRYLELVVRRDWQDDVALFGFWHPGQGTWEPGSEGLLELLLRAADDLEQEQGGLYSVLFEELNLASPEYYLSRVISALEAREPTIRLYGDDLAPTNRQRYPAAVPVGDNVRLLATVNIDETVERLSPRFLSRSAVVWVDPDVDRLLARAERPARALEPVDWHALRRAAAMGDPPALGPLEDVIRFLHERNVPGAPTARTIEALRRYLAASRDILPGPVAWDFLVLQRILPSFRAVGPSYGDLLDELGRMLRRHSLTRSARRCERLRERGQELGDYYDFFHA